MKTAERHYSGPSGVFIFEFKGTVKKCFSRFNDTLT